MIVFDLECRSAGHRFEGWFSSSEDFAGQQQRGLVTCPECGSPDVGKAVMAPNVGRKGNQLAPAPAKPQPMSKAKLPPEAMQMMQKLATMQAEALKNSRWVGESFAEDARAMHYGEREVENIHGQATLAEARDLLDEGIEVAPLPFPIAPPGEAN
jgi:hypothetical protein